MAGTCAHLKKIVPMTVTNDTSIVLTGKLLLEP